MARAPRHVRVSLERYSQATTHRSSTAFALLGKGHVDSEIRYSTGQHVPDVPNRAPSALRATVLPERKAAEVHASGMQRRWKRHSGYCIQSAFSALPLQRSLEHLVEVLPARNTPESDSPQDDLCSALVRALVLHRVLSEDVNFGAGPYLSSARNNGDKIVPSIGRIAAALCTRLRQASEHDSSSRRSSLPPSSSVTASVWAVSAPPERSGDISSLPSEIDVERVIHRLVGAAAQSHRSQLPSSEHGSTGWEIAAQLAASLPPGDSMAVDLLFQAAEREVQQCIDDHCVTGVQEHQLPRSVQHLTTLVRNAHKKHPSLSPALWLVLSHYLRWHKSPLTSCDNSTLAFGMPPALLDSVVTLFCDAESTQIIVLEKGRGGGRPCTTESRYAVSHRLGDDIGGNDDATTGGVTPSAIAAHTSWSGGSAVAQEGGSVFSSVWSRVVDELAVYAVAIFDTTATVAASRPDTEGGKQAKGRQLYSLRKSSERILRSFGRMIGSLRRRAHLGAVVELHRRLGLLGEWAHMADAAEMHTQGKSCGKGWSEGTESKCSTSLLSAVEMAQLSSPFTPRLRQCAMIDAYTLLTMGHLAETAADFNAAYADHGSQLLLHSGQLLRRLKRMHAVCDMDDRTVSSEADPRDSLLHKRLAEGMRVATKLLVRSGKIDTVTTLYEACPEMGPCWEVGMAYAAQGRHVDALRVYTGFLSATRTTFAASGLPSYVREKLLQALRAAVQRELQQRFTAPASTVPPREGDDGGLCRDINQSGNIENAASAIMLLYGIVRSWHSAVHPAVAFSEIINAVSTFTLPSLSLKGGMCTSVDCYANAEDCVTSSGAPRSDDTAESDHEKNRLLSAHDNGDAGIPNEWEHGGLDCVSTEVSTTAAKERGDNAESLFQTAVACVKAVCKVYPQDGILLLAVDGILTLWSRCIHVNADRRPDPALAELLVYIHQAHPSLPVFRVALVWLLKTHKPMASAALLHEMIALDGPSEALAVLQELPLIALQGLAKATQDTERNAETFTPHELCCSLVFEALKLRESADEARSPWRCYYCRVWNNKYSRMCKVCRALDMAVWMCPKCGAFCPTTSADCLICTYKRQQAVGDEVGREPKEVIVPLRAWRCSACSHENGSTHPFYCRSCGSVKPELQPILRATAFRCPDCGHNNIHGKLRPWCVVCGRLETSVAAAAAQKAALWRCVECRQLSPWLTAQCLSCGSSKPYSTSRTHLASWSQWQCGTCSSSNAVWARLCRSCGEDRVGGVVEVVSAATGVPSEGKVVGDVVSIANIDRTLEDASLSLSSSLVTCSHCGSPTMCEEAKTCLSCFSWQAVSKPKTVSSTSGETEIATVLHPAGSREHVILWVCLRSNCLGVNISAATDRDVSRCSDCGEPQGLLASTTYQSSPLSYSGNQPLSVVNPVAKICNSISNSSGASSGAKTEKYDVSGARPIHQAAVPTALQIPLPPSSRSCEQCGEPLSWSNVACVCRYCLTCSPTTSPEVALRVLLQVAQRTLERTREGLMSAGDALSLLRSIVARFVSASEKDLPWCGRDLVKGMRCGISPRYPILPQDEEVHSAIESMASLVLTCCRAAVQASADLRNGSSTRGSRNHSSTAIHDRHDSWKTTKRAGSDGRGGMEGNERLPISPLCGIASSEQQSGNREAERRAWLCVALDLVEVVNRSTDYDELGFDTLAELCLAIRPDQRDHIFRETRWLFLRDMKLSREGVVNGIACPYCLLPRSLGAETCGRDPCVHRVSPLVAETVDRITTPA